MDWVLKVWYVVRDVGICAQSVVYGQGRGYMCSRVWYVFKGVVTMCSKVRDVVRDVGICAQGCGMCSRAWICVQGCGMCSRVW
jgi:hypothetical protein